MDFDLVIRGGTIMDGTGRPGVRGEVGIRDGRIATLGEVKGAAAQTIDAGGLVVAPGFVDIHTHYDAQILWDRMMTISPWHGVTTVVMGNCGFGIAPTRPGGRETIARTLENVEGMSVEALFAGIPWTFETFPEYLDAVARTQPKLNVAVMLGHTPLRLYVLGEEAVERDATSAEIEEMRRIVGEALDAGAIGFASSRQPAHAGAWGKPVPSRLATVDELMRLAEPLGERGRGTFVIADPGTLGRHVAENSQTPPVIELLFDVWRDRLRLQPERVAAEVGQLSPFAIVWVVELRRIARQRVGRVMGHRERSMARRFGQAGTCMTVPQTLQVRCCRLEKKRAKISGSWLSILRTATRSR